jgi:predicted nucleotide-binding protein (sugar kinase/HSP70/actin superfamily)
MYLVLGIILGGAFMVVAYETYYEKKEEKIGSLLAPKLEKLIETSSMKIARKQKKLKRNLTEDEKNKILDECYNNM